MPSIFLDFHLPNAATWFYFSLLLAVALFFQFSRFLSLRNWDLLALFLLAPGFLILQDGHLALTAAVPEGTDPAVWAEAADRRIFCGYVWLLSASAYWFVRAVADLALLRRPLLSPNLNSAGLAWFGVALFVCLTTVAIRRTPAEAPADLGKRPAAIVQVQDVGTAVALHAQQSGTGPTWTPEAVRLGVERGLALGCQAAILVALVLIGGRLFLDWTAGAAMATLYLLLPYTAMNVGQLHHVWPSAFLTWAVFLYRRPTVSGWLLGLAAGSAFFPLLLFPLWLGFYWGRGGARFAVGFAAAAAISVGITVAVLWSDGRFLQSLQNVLLLSDWQPWKVPQTESVWTGAHWAYRMPVFVIFAAFVSGTAIWPSPKNLAHLVSLSAAVLIGVQFWYADRGGVYVLWYLPLLLFTAFRPNLSGHEPPVPESTRGFATRTVHFVLRRLGGRRLPAPVPSLAA